MGIGFRKPIADFAMTAKMRADLAVYRQAVAARAANAASAYVPYLFSKSAGGDTLNRVYEFKFRREVPDCLGAYESARIRL